MDKDDVVYMEYYPVVRKDTILSFAKTWIELKGAKLNKSEGERQILDDLLTCDS